MYEIAPNGIVSVIAGNRQSGFSDGIKSNARFYGPFSIVCSNDGLTLYVGDQSNSRVRQIDVKTCSVKTVVGDGRGDVNREGNGLQSSLYPSSLLVDEKESALYIGCYKAVMKWNMKSGDVSKVCEVGDYAYGLVAVNGGRMICRDYVNNKPQLAVIDSKLKSKQMIEISNYTWNYPMGQVVTNNGLFVMEHTQHTIVRVDIPAGLIAGSPLTPATPAAAALVVNDLEAKMNEQKLLQLSAQLKAEQQRTAVADQRATRAEANWKAAEQRALTAEQRAVAAKAQREALQIELNTLRIGPYQKEVNELAAVDWSGGAVLYWLSHLFVNEHKSAKISDFVTELTRRAANGKAIDVINGSRLLALKSPKDFRALNMTDFDTFALLTDAIEKLRIESDEHKAVTPNVASSDADLKGLQSKLDAAVAREQTMAAKVAVMEQAMKELTIERDAALAVAGVKDA